MNESPETPLTAETRQLLAKRLYVDGTPTLTPAGPAGKGDKTMAKSKRERIAAEYARLRAAIVALSDWAPEIEEELNKRGYGERYLTEVIDAACRVSDRDQ